MGRKRRDSNEPTRIKDNMTTMTVSKENKNKISFIVEWMEREIWKKEQKRKGYILNDGLSYLLDQINLNEYM